MHLLVYNTYPTSFLPFCLLSSFSYFLFKPSLFYIYVNKVYFLVFVVSVILTVCMLSKFV